MNLIFIGFLLEAINVNKIFYKFTLYISISVRQIILSLTTFIQKWFQHLYLSFNEIHVKT